RPMACASSVRSPAPPIPPCARSASACGPTPELHRASSWRWSVCRRHERGVALLGAVMALTALVLVATGLATTAAVDRRRTADALEGLQADALARSAGATASILRTQRARVGAPDSLRSPWAHGIGRQTVGPGWVEVGVEDEARRLDLNAPGSADALGRLLRRLGLDPSLADAVADWTDPDDEPRPHGAER